MLKLPRFFSPANKADNRYNFDRYGNALVEIVDEQRAHPVRTGDYIVEQGDYSVKINCRNGCMEISNVLSGELLYSFKLDVMNAPASVSNLLVNDRFVVFSISGYLNSRYLMCIELATGLQYNLARTTPAYQPINCVSLNGAILELDYSDAFCYPKTSKKVTFDLDKCAELNFRKLDEEASLPEKRLGSRP